MSVVEIIKAIRSKTKSATDVVKESLTKIKTTKCPVNACIYVADEESILAKAASVDAKIES